MAYIFTIKQDQVETGYSHDKGVSHAALCGHVDAKEFFIAALAIAVAAPPSPAAHETWRSKLHRRALEGKGRSPYWPNFARAHGPCDPPQVFTKKPTGKIKLNFRAILD